MPTIEKGHATIFSYEFEHSTITDISTWSFWYTVKSSVEDSDSDAILQYTETDMTITNNDDGDPVIVNIPISASDADIPIGTYHFDFWFKIGASDPQLGDRGKIIVEYPVTWSTT